MRILYENTVANSKAFLFLLEEYLALLKRGHGDNEFAYGNGAQCTYAVDDNDVIIGASAWFIDHNKRAAWILFTAVAESSRRQGVYTAMRKEIERIAKSKGAAALYLGTHVTNDAMIAATKAAGKQLGWYRAKKSL